MTSLYNDNDPYVAQWLGNLVQAGHLPQGTVDARSIVELSACDVSGYQQAHFFAGIGGWPLALEMAGWPATRPVWTGSCPCQPFSSAGQRKGDDDERHLWPEFRRLIAECRPATIFGEQVASGSGPKWFARVRADLEDQGYAVGAACLPAASVGVPHRRQRIFFVADADSISSGRQWRGQGRQGRSFGPVEFKRLVQAALQSAVPTGRYGSLHDGISNRMGRLRGYGNAIVPQVAAEFVRAFMETGRIELGFG